MSEITGSSGRAKSLQNLRPWPKGVSGNPAGTPKNSLKSYVAQKLAALTPEEKEAWLKDVGKELIWQMGEGRPHQTQETDLTTQGEKIESAAISDEVIAEAARIVKARQREKRA